MKKCTSSDCHFAPLTEFDHYFYDHLHPNAEVECYHCFKCQTSLSPLLKALKRQERQRTSIIWGIGFIIAEILIFLSAWLLHTIDESLVVLPALGVYVCYIVCAIVIIKNMNIMHKVETYDSAKTWYEARTTYDDKVVIEEHHTSESYGTGTAWYSILFGIVLFFTMLIWLIPYIVIIAVIQRRLLHRTCPKEILDVYYDTRKNVKYHDITQIGENKKRYTRHCRSLPKFIKKYDHITHKYLILGYDAINAQRKKLDCPLWKVTVEDIEYTVIAYSQEKEKIGMLNTNEPVYMIRRDNKNKMLGRAWVNGYLTQEESIHNLDQWAKETLNQYSDQYKTFSKYYLPYL